MRMLYLDSAGDAGLPNRSKTTNKYYVLAGLAIEPARWYYIDQRIKDILEKYFRPLGINPPKELKYSEIHHKKHPYDKLHNRNMLVDDIFSLIQDIDAVLFSIIVDKNKHVNRYINPEKPNILALRYIAPRFSKYLQRINDFGIIIYDAEEHHVNKELKDFLIRGRDDGIVLDPIYGQNRLENIIGTLLFEESHTSPPLQLADFIARTVFLKYERNNTKRFDQIQHLFDQYGIKEVP
ncbi:MAG: DUF3800 domain-containing protein [Candidatus Nitrosocaldus sp.]